MKHLNFGHLDGQQIVNSMIEELNKAKAELAKQGKLPTENIDRINKGQVDFNPLLDEIKSIAAKARQDLDESNVDDDDTNDKK